MPWTKGELLGEGAYGKVFECLNDDGTICAAKIMPLRQGDDERAKAAQAEIEKEVDLMSKLEHPNIVQYLGTERDATSLTIFLELVPGGSITNMLGKYGRFKEPIIRGYAREILQGLQYLHMNKILHRDVKGSNILVDHDGGCKLSDFGCSKMLSEATGEAASAQTLRGTPQFMAPEVLRNNGRGYTDKADVWSVGCTVVEMATAQRPWPDFASNEAVMYHVASRSHARPLTPTWMSQEGGDFLNLCFERDSEQRPSVEELLRHPMVVNANLAAKQRLGSRTADPSEISMVLPSPQKKGHLRDSSRSSRSSHRSAKHVDRQDGHDSFSEQDTTDDDDEDEQAPSTRPSTRASSRTGNAPMEPSTDFAQSGKHAGDGSSLGSESESEDEDEEVGSGGTPSSSAMRASRSSRSSVRSSGGFKSTPRVAGSRGGSVVGGGGGGTGSQSSSRDRRSAERTETGSETRGSGVDAGAGNGGLAAGGGNNGGLGVVSEVVAKDAQQAMVLVEEAQVFVQSVSSNRQKCFSLAQRMRRAKIPLEKLVLAAANGGGTGGGGAGGGVGGADELRHAVMDLRDALENAFELLRRHGRHHRVKALWVWLFRSSTERDFHEQEGELTTRMARLEQHFNKPGEEPELPPVSEPPLWSRRIVRGDRSQMRTIVMAADRRLWCGSKVIRVLNADGRRMEKTITQPPFGLVRCILEVAVDGSSLPASNVQALRTVSKQMWTGHSDGRIRVWDAESMDLRTELAVDPAVRTPVLCMAQVGQEIWVGTMAGSLFALPIAGGAARELTAASGSQRRHEGAVRCLLSVGGQLWSGSESAEIFVWDAERKPGSLLQKMEREGGAVSAMIRLPDGGVLSGHKSGIVQVWGVDGARHSWAHSRSAVKSAVLAGNLAWTGHSDGHFRLWTILDDCGVELFRSVPAHHTAVLGMVKDAVSVWSCTKNGTLRQWSIALLIMDKVLEPGVVSSRRSNPTLRSAGGIAHRRAGGSTLGGRAPIGEPQQPGAGGQITQTELLLAISEGLCPEEGEVSGVAQAEGGSSGGPQDGMQSGSEEGGGVPEHNQAARLSGAGQSVASELGSESAAHLAFASRQPLDTTRPSASGGVMRTLAAAWSKVSSTLSGSRSRHTAAHGPTPEGSRQGLHV